jgi:toxin ParE1/3/4
MAYNVIWSPGAISDLHEIVRFIARDSQSRAEAFGYRLMTEVDKLRQFPELGRRVPEFQSATHRQIVLRAYRIIYRIDHYQRTVEIARVWHAGRGTPRI